MQELTDQSFNLTLTNEDKPAIIVFFKNDIDNINNQIMLENIEYLEKYNKGINYYFVYLNKNPDIQRATQKFYEEELKEANSIMLSYKKGIFLEGVTDNLPIERYIKLVNKMLDKKFEPELQKLFNVDENGEYLHKEEQ